MIESASSVVPKMNVGCVSVVAPASASSSATGKMTGPLAQEDAREEGVRDRIQRQDHGVAERQLRQRRKVEHDVRRGDGAPQPGPELLFFPWEVLALAPRGGVPRPPFAGVPSRA